MRLITSSDNTRPMQLALQRRCRQRRCKMTLPTRATSGNVPVSVGPSELLPQPGQLGLFAGVDIAKHTVACSFRTISLTVPQSEKRQARLGLEAFPDSRFYDRDRVLHDVSFTSADNVPCWYRLNHSYYPNLRLVSWQHGVVEWMAEVDIKKGAELTFKYGRPNPYWLRSM